ncbi:clarin-3 [Hemicordylus capensis]|uniref:clarin-3 n=1 Tax=Hemicordylus capensis TaxID=884348 RepID=UPI0023044574|nr:clarin-3 [Hemicordylus capensis]
MPSRRKSLIFSLASFTSICSFVIVCLVLATKNWVSSTITYTGRNSSVAIFITYGLFEGFCSEVVQAGIGRGETKFQVSIWNLPENLKHFNIAIIILLVLSLASSVLSSGFTCYNAMSNPYETFLGPVGVYTWNSISSVCSLLTLILFAVNVEANKLSVELAITYCDESSRQSAHSNSYKYSYWLMLLIVLLNAATISIIVYYQHARYSEKKARERPMESAPKDGILF